MLQKRPSSVNVLSACSQPGQLAISFHWVEREHAVKSFAAFRSNVQTEKQAAGRVTLNQAYKNDSQVHFRRDRFHCDRGPAVWAPGTCFTNGVMSAVDGRTPTRTDNKATNTKSFYYTEKRVTHETASTALRWKVILTWMFSAAAVPRVSRKCMLFL